MSELFSVLPLYDANMQAEERTIVNQGGTSSGKTYSIMQVLFTIGLMDVRSVITVVGQDVPNLKKGAYRDAKTILEGSELLSEWWPSINEGERLIKCVNGSIIEFSSFKDAQDAKSGKRDYLFINEANGISYEVYWQLAIRTRKKVFIDYNPTARFWVHDELIGRKGVRLIISDHRKNYFLTQEEHDRIEGIEDEELWKVYARGLTGKIAGLVLTNWDICDILPPRDEWKMSCRGLDFGFTCFRGDTLVMTSEGEKPIMLVKAGDYVLTRKGYHRVKRNIYNGYKKVIRKKLRIGLQESDFFCTFEHNFNVNGKWKKYGQLTREDNLYVLSSSMAWSSEDIQVVNTETITTTNGRKTENISKNCCTMQSMRKSMVRFLLAWSYTTKILTRLITTSIIWSCSQFLSTCKYIMRLANGEMSIPKSSENEVTQKKTGTNEERRCLTASRMSDEFVNGAERSSRQQTPISDSAVSHVITDGNIKHQRIIYKWFANIAGKLSRVINTLSQSVAAKNVRISYHSLNNIKDCGEEWCYVYDLEIEGVHEYFANGVLVHNCDPTALEHVVLAHGELWIEEEIYSTGLTNPDIAQRAKNEGVGGSDQIIADCAEPKSIRELQAQGLWVTASPKGQDSIVSGLDILKRYRMHVTRRSMGLIANLRSYQWGKDRDGNMTNKPEDKNNHGIDAIRYVALAKLAEHREARGVRRRN